MTANYMTGIEALQALKNGAKIQCVGWNDDFYIEILQSGHNEGAVVFSPQFARCFMHEGQIRANFVYQGLVSIVEELCNHQWRIVD